MLRQFKPWILCFSMGLYSCTPPASAPLGLPTYDPFIPLSQSSPDAAAEISEQSDAALTGTPTRPIPARAPLAVILPSPAGSDLPLATPTGDAPRLLPTSRPAEEEYMVEAGDTVFGIARAHDISAESLLAANGLTYPDVLEVGMALTIPPPETGAPGPAFKLIPDSELVFGPAAALLDVPGFIAGHSGYLAGYTEEIDGELLTADEIVSRVSRNHSVNPRLLLAVLEYQSGWLTDPAPVGTDFPLGLVDAAHAGLYRQLSWAADALNRGYYLWRVNGVAAWILLDGSAVSVAPSINAGTAGLQNLFAQLSGPVLWEQAVGPLGFIRTYTGLFGDPFALAIEPLLPASLTQPKMALPFERGDTWSLTGGPHGGWDSGSGWAALDFGPPGDTASCLPSGAWVTAVADGLIVRASNGAVIQDLSNDGYEQTGWVVLYMHIHSGERVHPGTYLFAGQRLGHASCEGGFSNGTHLHIARRYNGEWIPADGALPFVMDGWVSGGNGIEYDGFLARGTQRVEAWDGVNALNQISR